jgi:hypothetical protein
MRRAVLRIAEPARTPPRYRQSDGILAGRSHSTDFRVSLGENAMRAGGQMRSTRKNVIILTSGLTGSSVVTGVLKDAGFWVGPETARKPGYDTFENCDLIALNERLVEEAGYPVPSDQLLRSEQTDDLVKRLGGINPESYQQFVRECDLHSPWVWKDPRLRLTMPFWVRLLDPDRINILIIDRECPQAWVSHILRRHIQTPRYYEKYVDGVQSSLLHFVKEFRLNYMEIVYENLLLEPEQTLQELNNFIGTEISMQNLHRIYHGPLYRRGHGTVDYLHAALIYLKNYASRSRMNSLYFR